MQNSAKDLWRRWIGTNATVWAAVLGTAIFVGGCSSTNSSFDPTREPVQRLLPRITEVVTGPVAGSLTNLNGYHGRFTISFGTSGENQTVVTGDLYERDGKLCFRPVLKKSKRKDIDAGTFSVIWDTAGNQGHVLSEGLQGFAPLTGGDTYKPGDLRVERDKDLNGLATRIELPDAMRPFTFTLFDVKTGSPPADLFATPDGFTKYDSEGALLGELAARQRSVAGVRRKDDGDLGPYISEPGVQRPRSTGY